jgi:manganese/zinc/iron transport system permease protein
VTPFDPGLDLFPLLAATLAAATCGLLGNFLVLRRLSLMGDAISHSVLPGLVVAFILTGSRSPFPMFLGAAAAGIATVGLVELVKRLGRVEPGAAMGVVFSVLFALGVLLIESGGARHIDLDADCVLHGQLETLVWYDPPGSLAGLLSLDTLRAAPRQVTTLLGVLLATAAFVTLLYKELRLAAFDPDLATTQGFNATLLNALFMLFVAAATVASFEAVGSILVIAMLVCPAATARLLTDRLASQIWCSLALAVAGAISGYLGATWIPMRFGVDSVNAAGSITLALGGLLVIAVIASPRHGLVRRLLRRRQLAGEIAHDDLLATLFRASEAGEPRLTPSRLHTLLPGRAVRAATARATRRGLLATDRRGISLTESGLHAGAEIVRRHRLWEHYLVDRAGLAPDHVHEPAERLEHFGSGPAPGPATDPHGKPIPGSGPGEDPERPPQK